MAPWWSQAPKQAFILLTPEGGSSRSDYKSLKSLALRRGGNLSSRTSVLTQERVVADGARLGEGVELVQPLSGDVELQQAGLLHAGQSHHLLPLPHRLLAAFPAEA